MQFSIVIPTLNEEKYLPRLLDNIVKQQGKHDFEIFVVDAESTDQTISVAKSFSSKLPVKILRARVRNLSFQRNLGAQRAKGDYLIFLDADSQIPNNFLQNLKSELAKCAYLICIPEIKTSRDSLIDQNIIKIANYLITVAKYIQRPFAAGACLIIHRYTFLHLDGFTITQLHEKKVLFSEDADFLIRARQTGIIAAQLKTVNFIFSFRRIEKEGYLVVATKYIIAGIEMILLQATTTTIPYQMGGDYYADIGDKQLNKKKLRSMLTKIQKDLSKLVTIESTPKK
ncbi:glycosyltransferase [Candidatus Woesebacteria bacterium]|nr:glycosyltransferase [Candidatus Woesebacteria bacterium]